MARILWGRLMNETRAPRTRGHLAAEALQSGQVLGLKRAWLTLGFTVPGYPSELDSFSSLVKGPSEVQTEWSSVKPDFNFPLFSTFLSLLPLNSNFHSG